MNQPTSGAVAANRGLLEIGRLSRHRFYLFGIFLFCEFRMFLEIVLKSGFKSFLRQHGTMNLHRGETTQSIHHFLI